MSDVILPTIALLVFMASVYFLATHVEQIDHWLRKKK